MHPAPTLQDGLARAIEAYNAGRRAEAEDIGRRLLQAHGSHPALEQWLAVLCQERGAPVEALDHVRRSLAARPGHVPTLVVAGLVHQDLRQFDAAASALEAVLEVEPRHAAARVNLGIVRLEQGRLDDALREFGRAYVLRPEAFGRIANALTSSATGALWLDPAALARTLADRAAVA